MLSQQRASVIRSRIDRKQLLVQDEIEALGVEIEVAEQEDATNRQIKTIERRARNVKEVIEEIAASSTE